MNPGENCPGCANKAEPISRGGNRLLAFKPRGPHGPTVYRDMTGIPPEAVQRLQDSSGVLALLASATNATGGAGGVLLDETPGVNLTPAPVGHGSMLDSLGDWGPVRESDRFVQRGYRWKSP